MNPYVGDNEFSDLLPKNFKTDILPDEAEPKDLLVYRICFEGEINAEAFESTYETRLKEQNFDKLDLTDAATYSTSCFTKKNGAKKSYKMFQKHHPNAVIAKGQTGIEDGLLLETPNSHRGHVNWWIYKGHDVAYRFSDVTQNLLEKKDGEESL